MNIIKQMCSLNEDVILYIASYLLDIADVVSLSVASKDYLFLRKISFTRTINIYLHKCRDGSIDTIEYIETGDRKCTYDLSCGYHGPQYVYEYNQLSGYFEYDNNKRIIQIFEDADDVHNLYIINDMVYSEFVFNDKYPLYDAYTKLMNDVMALPVINKEIVDQITSKYFNDDMINLEFWNYHD